MTKARDLASGQNGIRPFAMASGKSPLLTATLSGVYGGYYTNATVTLPVGRFTQTPQVTTGIEPSYLENMSDFVSMNNGTTSFLVWIWSARSSASGYIYWTAVQMTSSAAAG